MLPPAPILRRVRCDRAQRSRSKKLKRRRKKGHATSRQPLSSQEWQILAAPLILENRFVYPLPWLGVAAAALDAAATPLPPPPPAARRGLITGTTVAALSLPAARDEAPPPTFIFFAERRIALFIVTSKSHLSHSPHVCLSSEVNCPLRSWTLCRISQHAPGQTDTPTARVSSFEQPMQRNRVLLPQPPLNPHTTQGRG